MAGKSVVWGAGEGWSSVPAGHRVCCGVLSAADPLGAAALQLCAGWQVGVWRREECVWEVLGHWNRGLWWKLRKSQFFYSWQKGS